MRKLLGIILTFILITVTGLSAYADSQTAVEILTARVENGVVTMNAKIENPVENQQLTVMAAVYKNDSFDYNNIAYINQYDYTENKIITFKYGQWADLDEIYALKVGGTDIDKPAFFLLNAQSGTIAYGDVDCDGKITANDSAFTLQYVLNPTSVELEEQQLSRARVNGNEIISAKEAACILQKVLNNAYKFVVEEGL